MDDSAERSYGTRHFMEAAPDFPSLSSSRYYMHITALNEGFGNIACYPGSAMLAMTELKGSCSYLLCELDVESDGDLRRACSRLGWKNGPTCARATG